MVASRLPGWSTRTLPWGVHSVIPDLSVDMNTVGISMIRLHISWLLINQMADYPGWAWPNQVSPQKRDWAPPEVRWLWRCKLLCYQRVTELEPESDAANKVGTVSEKAGNSAVQQENGDLSSMTPRNWILPTPREPGWGLQAS